MDFDGIEYGSGADLHCHSHSYISSPNKCILGPSFRGWKSGKCKLNLKLLCKDRASKLGVDGYLFSISVTHCGHKQGQPPRLALTEYALIR